MAVANGAGAGVGQEGGAAGAFPTPAVCGNGLVEAGEECEPDAGTPCTAGCSVDCGAFINGGAMLVFADGTVHCYSVLAYDRDWGDSSVRCGDFNGYLVSIHDDEEQAIVRSLIPVDQTVWIGATDGRSPDDPVPGTYTWETDEPFAYTPVDGFDVATGDCGVDCPHCATITGGSNEAWSVDVCSTARRGICEWDSASPG
ncbi:MAG: C-type lectin domain-containing protein [Polyangiaceae bacterium]|nr:C-type lectin domain-containing protein [Polyangiaceae bacterium]